MTRLNHLILAASVAALLAPFSAQAATYFWDGGSADLSDPGDGMSQGGAGTWDAILKNWDLAGVYSAWPNSVTDEAFFGGTAATVSLGATITANQLTFATGGYTIDNGGTAGNILTLGGTTPTVTVTNAPDTATISAVVAGSAGLTKAGNGTLVLGGTNTYTGTTTISGGAISISADLNLGAAPGAATAGNLTLSGGTLATTASFALSSNRGIALGGSGGTIDVASATTLTYGGILAGTGGLTKTGAGTLSLATATNTFSGGITLNGGTLSYDADARLGTAANGITFINGTLNFTGAAYTSARALTVNAGSSGTLQTPGTGATSTSGKITIASALLTGSGTFTKLGAGDMQFTAAQTFAGTFIVGGGIELSVANALGASTAIQIQNGGEMAVSANQGNAITITNNGTGSAPIISSIGNGTSSLTGSIVVSSALSVALRGFNNTANGFNLTFSGPLSGSGVITLSGATTLGQTLFLNGNNSGYTASFNVPAGLNLSFGAINSFGTGTVTINSTTTNIGGLGAGYDFGGALPTFTNTRTGTATGGVFGINTTLAATTTLNLATLGGGGMFLGSQSAGTYAATTLTPDGATYRLGGGMGKLTLTGTNAITGANALTAGDSRVNGGGTVVLAAANDYTGATTVNGGMTLQVANDGALGSTATGTTVNAGGSLGLSGGVTVNEPVTIAGTGSTASVTNLVNGLVNVSGTNTYTGQINATTNSNNVRVSVTAGILNLPGNIIMSGGGTANGLVFAGTAGTINQTGVLSGAGSVFVTSTATVNASTLNTYTGVTTFQNTAGTFNVLTFNSVNGGTPLMSSSSLGAPTTVANGTLQFGTTTTAGSVTYVGTGETTDRVINLAGTTAGGTITQSGTGLLKFTSNLTATGAGIKTLTLQGSTAATGEIAGVIVNNSATNVTNVLKGGTGIWTLSGLNTYSGTTAVNQGTLVISSVTAVGGAASNLGSPTTVANGTIGLGSGSTTPLSGTLQYIGTGSTTDRVINLASTTGGGTLDQSGTGTFQVGAVTATGAGIKTLTLTGSTAGAGVVGGAIANNTATNTTAVTKTGTGTWTLAGANTYTGATTVSAGLLRITGNSSAANGAVNVNGGGYLGGTGTVGGAVTVAVNGGIDLRDGAIGTLTLSSTLSLSGTAATPSTMAFDLGSSTVDLIAATGAVTASTAGGVLVSFNQISGTPLANGTYTLITSGATSVPAGFALATTQSGGHTYSLTTGTAGNILQVAVGTATTGPAAAVWGGTSAAWNSAGNWYTDATSGTPGAVPGVGTNVSFYTTNPATTNLSPTLGADFEINSLTFLSTATSAVTIGGTTNALTIDAGTANGNTAGNGINQLSAQTQTISSRLGIGGVQTWNVAAGGGLTVSGLVFDTGSGFTLTKAGNGTLTLSGTANTFTGDINVTGGILAFAGNGGASGDPLSLGAGTKTITITNNATIRPTSSANPTSANTKRFVVGAGGATFDAPTGVTFTLDDAGQFSGTDDLTVTGTGTGIVYLHNQANNFSGNVIINSGTLRLGTNSVLGTSAGRTITVNSGGTLDTNTTVTATNVPLDIVLNGGTLSATSASGSFAQTISLTAGSFVSAGSGFTETVSTDITGGFSLTKTGTGTTILSGTNTYAATSGPTTIVSAGVLQVTTTASLPNYSTAGQVSVASGGMLTLNVGGTGEFGNADVAALLSGGTFASGSGIGLDTTNAGGTFTAPALMPVPTVGLFNFMKLGAGTLILPGTNSFGAGTTTIRNGSVSVTSGVTNALGTGALVLGTTGGTPAGLDLGTSNQTVTTLTVPANSGTASTIAIGSGNTLVVTGAVTIGTAGTSTTKLTVTGATGTFSIGTAGTATNANVQIGANVTDAVSNGATVDLSGVGAFFANIGTGTFRVGDVTNGTGSATQSSTLILAPSSTIIATTITSDSPDSGQTEAIKLGSGVNSFQATTITIGAAGNRASGTLTFNTGTGTLKVRGLAGGSSRSVLNVAYGNSTTAATPTATVDLTGHSADLLLSSLNVGGRTGSNGGAMTGTFSFDAGTLDATAVIAGSRASTASTGNVGTSTGTINLGGGNVIVGTTGISIAPNTSTLAGSPTVGAVNISGGTVSVGATGGGNITLGSSANANGPSTATLNITGGSLTVNGNIAKGTITGTVTSTVTLNGSDALLDLAGHSIGTAAAPINTLTFTAGTLQNVAAINGTGGVIKSAPGTLTLAGTNGYSGGTTVTAGTVLVSGSITGSVNVSNNAIFGGAGTVFTGANGTVNVASDGVIAPGSTTPGATIDTLTIDATGRTIGPALSFASGATFTFELNTGVMTNDSIAIAHASSGSVAFLNNTINFSDLSGGALSNMDYVLFSADAANAYSGLSTDGDGFITSGLSFTGLNVYPEAALRVVDNNIVLTAVPEPASAAMLLAGMGSLLGLMRFRRRRA